MILNLDFSKISSEFNAAKTPVALKEIAAKYLEGIKASFAELKSFSVSKRAELAPLLQKQKQDLEVLFESRKAVLESFQEKKNAKELADRQIGLPIKLGHAHPISQTIRQMNEFFIRLGFSVYDGPEIETDEFNFRRLNVPKDHPARDMQDTIYIDAPNILLRTQTSSIEARALASIKPPFRIVSPARVYRNEKANKSNHFIFHQYQGVVVQPRVSLSELFGVLEMLFKDLYGDKVVLRFRSKYYPEVEPGVGPDMRCFNCVGKGCVVCKYVGWIEMAGAGIIHERILKMAGLDPRKWMGFAFGLGLDRWVMAKYGITDIRTLLGGNLAYKYFEHESFFSSHA